MAITNSLTQTFAAGFPSKFIASQIDLLKQSGANIAPPIESVGNGFTAQQLVAMQGRVLGGYSPSIAPIVEYVPVANTGGQTSRPVSRVPRSPVNGASVPARAVGVNRPTATPQRSAPIGGASASALSNASLAPLAGLAPLTTLAPIVQPGSVTAAQSAPGHITVTVPIATSAPLHVYRVPAMATNAGGPFQPTVFGGISTDHTIALTAA